MTTDGFLLRSDEADDTMKSRVSKDVTRHNFAKLHDT